MSNERLIYLPLGGAGEIGMNCYVYGYGKPGKERLIVVDLGVTFPNMDTTPGVDLILPDISWLEARKDQIEAIFITHAHEDHIGAIGHYFARLGSVVYARAFTANIARRKLADHGFSSKVVQVVSSWPQMVNAGPFSIGFVPVAHSIPESSALAIDTPAGRIIHTGDFKLDETPVVGEAFDPELWKEVSKPGVKALICDSTNIFNPTAGRSESAVGKETEALIEHAKGMVVATTFASNVARLKTIADAGVRAGRSVCLMGRAMQRMVEAAKETGVLKGFPPVISTDEARSLPRNQVLLLVTGSQGERRAASAQLAQGKFQGLSLKEGDLFLFSSKTIPGNERGVIRIVNQFSEMGVDVVDENSAKLYHVSGHANRPDIETMHALVKPKIVVPMHGEHRHLREHARIANRAGMQSIVAVNGMMIDLTTDEPKITEHIEISRTYLDGNTLIGALDGVVRDRIRMALNGHIAVSLIVDEENEPLGDPWVDLIGLPEIGRSQQPLADAIEEELSQQMTRMKAVVLADDDKLEDTLKKAVRRSVATEIGKKPEVSVIISRLM